MSEERFNKLPKWAQIEIQKLTSDLASANEKINALFYNGKTNTVIISGLDEMPLPNNSNIRFSWGKTHIDARIVDEELRIYGQSAIHIQPRATNTCYIIAD